MDRSTLHPKEVCGLRYGSGRNEDGREKEKEKERERERERERKLCQAGIRRGYSQSPRWLYVDEATWITRPPRHKSILSHWLFLGIVQKVLLPAVL
ncbi:hypothetical protein HZH68_005041 [Vespula germanica]|uniref:Uncharacterized protein n=1 Tax=Vespula germanica TaxID=30212 RepID=A0A834KGT0_VESGE|nr:hypothetical protein HZH68_005041 [Vespula germanica]